MEISDAQLHRYARHVILDEVGEEGQARLLQAKVLVVGAGGLGAPLIQYLAAAGVGTLGIIDDDAVELSNLQRQVLFRTDQLGRPKVDCAVEAVAAINPEILVRPYNRRLTAENAADIIDDYDLVADGSDNFTTRYVLNDACFFAAKTLVGGALLRFDGQLSTFKAYVEGEHPCYRCLFPDRPPADLVPRCEEAGIFGAVAGVVGSLQATEVLKEILSLGQSLSGRLLLYDGLAGSFTTLTVKRDPACALCGAIPSIGDDDIGRA
ncbi:MAG: molybdopterin-synthase adenylyltransferase MoeB [Alphaproteobacteria bacterium]|nr:molybdopterin-synthase adenylyltransferase MoeB [Alphaproteobacteria bacterium]